MPQLRKTSRDPQSNRRSGSAHLVQFLRVLFSGLGPTEKAQQNVMLSALLDLCRMVTFCGLFRWLLVLEPWQAKFDNSPAWRVKL